MSLHKIVPVPFYFGIVAVLFCSCANSSATIHSASARPNESIGPADKVEVVYFHRHRRCEACIYAEERISYIVKTYFQDELASGNYDVEDKDSAALMKKFGAIGSQLFVNRIKNNVDHIRYIEEIWYWGCIDNEEVFDRTVKKVIKENIYGR